VDCFGSRQGPVAVLVSPRVLSVESKLIKKRIYFSHLMLIMLINAERVQKFGYGPHLDVMPLRFTFIYSLLPPL
jgi:hypothetical protein